MSRSFAWLFVGIILLLAFVYNSKNIPQVKQQAAVKQSQEVGPKPVRSPETEPLVTITGPLANWVQPQKPSEDASEPSPPPKPHPSDHFNASPTSGGIALVHKKFALITSVRFPFEVPPHVLTPKLHGTYRSFVQPAGSETGGATPDVEFLLLNEYQYAGFLRVGSGDAVFSVDSSHDQDVNFVLPASRDRPVRYYLVFRNTSRPQAKVVQADLRVDF